VLDRHGRRGWSISARDKASNQQAASERRAVKEDELHAELEQQGQRDDGAGSATWSSWRTSGARSSSSASLTWWCTWHSASSRICAKIRQRRQHQGHRRMQLQDNVRAVIVKEVQLRNPVLTGALRCSSRASPSTSSPTFNCPLPRFRRPPADLNAATTDKDCDPSGSRSSANGLWGQGPPTSTWSAPTRTAIRAARRSSATDYGARARAGGTCLVVVLHAASVIGCWRRAAGAASLRTAPDAPPPHLVMLAASSTATNIQ